MMATADRMLLAAVLAAGVAGLILVGLAAAPEEQQNAIGNGSTFAAGPKGTGALYQYLERSGMHPQVLKTGDLAVPDGAALAMIDTPLSEPEAAVLLERVRGGLKVLVASGSENEALFNALSLPVNASGAPGRMLVAWPSAAVREVDRIEVEVPTRAQPAAGFVELMADDAGAGAVEKRLGAGELVILLDPAVVENGGLPRSHNLHFADSVLRHLAGPGGVVVFDEFHHGFGLERSVAGWFSRAGLTPALWIFGLAFGVEALRRFTTRVGPPRPSPVPERRAAREFIGGYSRLLRASGHRSWAVKALTKGLRRRLQDDFGIPAGVPPAAVFRLLAARAPQAAARAYRALERGDEIGAASKVTDAELLDVARDVRLTDRALGTVRVRQR